MFAALQSHLGGKCSLPYSPRLVSSDQSGVNTGITSLLTWHCLCTPRVIGLDVWLMVNNPCAYTLQKTVSGIFLDSIDCSLINLSKRGALTFNN